MIADTCKLLELETQHIARLLMKEMSRPSSLATRLWMQPHWDDRLLAWAMTNPALQVQIFRLIDVLPSLTDNVEIARHIQEYLSLPEVKLPSGLNTLLSWAQPHSILGKVAAVTFKSAVSTLARRYIVGETLPQTLPRLVQLRQHCLAFTLDRLGEAVITEAEATAYLQGYLHLMTQLAQAAKAWSEIALIDRVEGVAFPKVQVSVKLTAFYSQFDPLDAQGSQEIVSQHLRTLLRHAQKLGVAVHFDMEQFVYKDLTLAILKDLLLEPEFRNRTDIGLTLQAYLRDSNQDLHTLIDWAQERGTSITIRLVKGAYWDQETIKAIQNHWPQPVLNDKAETDANFEAMTLTLLENHEIVTAAIGSHNVRSQAHAIAIANRLQIPKHRYELQVLYGMADPLAAAIAHLGHRVRVYCPYGPLLPGMAYLIRRLLENTANTSFLRQRIESPDPEKLLAPPQGKHEGKQHSVVQPTAQHELSEDAPYNNVANTDYSQVTAREQTKQALQQVRQELGKPYWPWIAGQAMITDQIQASVNPSQPTQVIGQVGQALIPQTERAIKAAATAMASWQNTSAQERVMHLRRAADLMEQRRHELAAWIVLEVGKVLPEADAEVSEAIDFCRYYADEMERLSAGYQRDLPGETNRYAYRGRGIVVVIAPWNFPLAIATGMTVAALVTGNCTILKPAAPATVVAAKLTEILVEAGFPAGVYQYLPGPGAEIGPYLTRHPQIHLIAFTGSQAVGSQIYEDAAVLRPGQTHLKRVIAEMGGKNAIIIDQSADLDQAITGVIRSAFGYSGQKCSACSRVIVLDRIYDTFLKRLVEAAKSLNIGAADQASTTVGPVITAEVQAKIRDYIALGKTEAKVVLERTAPEFGYFVGPVIFSEVPPQAQIAQQEIFGPVLSVIRVQTFEDAISVANNSPYALTGGLYSRTPSHIEFTKTNFEVGNLYINRSITGAIVDRQPFGGFKCSGVGSKAGGRDYLMQFMEPRVVTENIQRQGFAPVGELFT
ncbi:delta-1-pyrroline-5-carboxylate dehydrogenase (plasmid) [Acaryochloris marina MBIC11017]|uniref:L-glutamate gamma-semialdehyde dehydrogenase n=2 Tax=Acaryochloris marina TaxID=155978 RepID=A8ZMR8_ACAM1|nr:delta-1-pyrroline-5-carboxylate dehydrogenase [Acaryochloris marina MBIC11017]